MATTYISSRASIEFDPDDCAAPDPTVVPLVTIGQFKRGREVVRVYRRADDGRLVVFANMAAAGGDEEPLRITVPASEVNLAALRKLGIHATEIR